MYSIRHVLDKTEAEGDVLIATERVEAFRVKLQMDKAHVTCIHRLHADTLVPLSKRMHVKSIKRSHIPVDEQSQLASEMRSLVASITFFRRLPWTNLASNMITCHAGDERG